MSENRKLEIFVPASKGTVDTKGSLVTLKEAGWVTAEMKKVATLVEKKPATQEKKVTIPMKAPAPAVDNAPYNWVWAMLRTLTFRKTDVNETLKGPLVYPNFPKVAEGGGLAWLEPVLAGNEPTNSAANGYFVVAKGKPEILSVEWREYTPNSDGKIITKGTKRFGESVQLHIYTRALYGEDIYIHLMNHNMVLKDNELPVWERENKQADIPKGKETPEGSIKTFTRQVNMVGILEDERARGTLQITDVVVKFRTAQEKKESGPGIPAKNFVQKAVVDVYLDELWIPDAGKELEIYATINNKTGKLSKTFKSSVLNVKGPKTDDSPLMMNGNKPVVVGDIPTNPRRFQPCKYSAIMVESKDGKQAIFDENVLGFQPPEHLTYNVVAGSEAAAQNIKVTVEAVVTNDSECVATPKHKNHVIDLASFVGKGYKLEDKKAGVKREKPEESVVKGKSEQKFNNYKIKRETSSSFSGVIAHSDGGIELDAQYKYAFSDERGLPDVKRILGYLWIPAAQIDHFPVTIQTCRWKHIINFAIYPDIKWTAALAFNMKEEDFKQLKEKFANDNKGKGITGKMQRFVLNRMESVEKIGDKVKDKYSKPTPVLDHYNETNAREIGQMLALPESKDAPAAEVKTKGKFTELLEVLRKFQFSIKVEWNNDKESIEPIQELVQKYCGMIKKVWELAQGAKDILEGKYTTKADVEGDGKDPDAFINKNKGSADKNIQGLISKMQRKPVDYELQFPKVGLAASWYYETMPPVDKSSELWGAGKTVLIKLEAKPLIGLEVKWDFLELLCRRHPLAYAILKTVDALLYLLADDESKVVLNVSITGKIDMEATFKHNTVGGNVFTREAGHSDKKEELIKGGAFISVKVECKLNLAKTTTFLKTKVVVSFGMGLEGSSGLGLQGIFGSDEKGLYLGLDLVFEGIKIEGMVEGKISISEKAREKKKKGAAPTPEVAEKPAKYNSIFDYNPKASFEIAIDEKRLSLPKLYLTKKESDG